MSKSLKLFCLLILSVWLVLLAPGHSCARPAAEAAYDTVKADYNRFMADPSLWGQRVRWEKLIRRFDKLARTYPSSKRADDSLYLAAGLYFSLYNYSYRKSDLQQAAQRYQALLRNYAASRLADDALFSLGNIAFKQNDFSQAQSLWQRLLKEYPEGDMCARGTAALNSLLPASTSPAPRKHPRSCKNKNLDPVAKTAPQVLSKSPDSRTDAGRVLDLRHWSSPTYTRVVLDLDRETEFTKGILKDRENRNKTKSIYLNLKNTILPEVSREVAINDGILRQVKVAQYNRSTVRAVVHVAEIDHYKIFALSNPPRIVIDVIGGEFLKNRARRQDPAGTLPAAGETPSLAQQLGLGVGTIVIDAGHGGKDPGALSASGAQEKDIVLDISRRLRDELKNRVQCQVHTTRDHDRFLPLEERTVVANTKKADLFISIHANACRNRQAHGVETYFLNLSTDKEAMELAALENSTSTKNISQLQTILNDLMQNSKIKESSRLATVVHQGLVEKLRGNYSKIKDLGVKQAPFYVLIGAQMPSILVEVSFISNRMEAERLASAKYRQKVAEGLADGIEKYIKEIKLARL